MVVYPPSHRLPWSARFVPRDEPGDDDAGGRPHEPFHVPLVPDVAGVIPGRVPAVVALVLPLGAVRIHLDGAECGADRYVSKRRVQGFEQLLAEPHSGRDREIGVVRDVRNAVEVRNLAVEHLAHEEMLRKPDPAEFFEGFHGGGFAHGVFTRWVVTVARWRGRGTPVLDGRTTARAERAAVHVPDSRSLLRRPPRGSRVVATRRRSSELRRAGTRRAAGARQRHRRGDHRDRLVRGGPRHCS